jgi:hypothetical protein
MPMNVIQGGPTPIVTAAVAEALAPRQDKRDTVAREPVKPPPKGEASQRYGTRPDPDSSRGHKVDKEA